MDARRTGLGLAGGLVALGLSPLMLAQGLYVRRTVPTLPEPEGPRQGELGQGPELRVLIVGDSSAAGVGAEYQEQALSGRLAEALARDFRVSWLLVAQSGFTTQEVIDHLQVVTPQVWDVALSVTGVNDATSGCRPKAFLARQKRLVTLLRHRFQVKRVVLSGLPPMHRFPSLPQPLRWYLGARAQALDAALERWAGLQPVCDYLPLNFDMDVEDMADDGFHPGPKVYEQWGQAVAEVIKAKMA
ncbi:MAG: SGNH/GDSL hydrolase family protein [Desulfarculaceae bacterium]|nr:SGNH/GDSL hydrolase family protein [Desulfarculaceae bacterium]MCF8099521.1 SGNH/GDSL hydrolase family protein [Desulfarculaceae bacterium]MCF8121989.1 SGNH/GDSL hydrolase family protein [Desulfarculaceae bacterium]